MPAIKILMETEWQTFLKMVASAVKGINLLNGEEGNITL